tara:strand:+ start:77 stop:991 length:915 start_codon:yes stop_codon:yes gene_type:complete
MGTTYSIKITQPIINQNKIQRDVDSILYSINMEMSTYIDSSDISRFNKSSPGLKYSLKDDFYKVISVARDFYNTTNGYFDITINPLVELWGFSKGGYIETIPSPELIDSTLKYIGMEKLIIGEDKSITKEKTLTIDLSAIAKGYAVDKISEYLDELSFNNYMVEIGGEVRALGKKNKDEGWIIGVQNPNKDDVDSILKINLLNKSLATSGNYRNYYDIDGKKYSHIISPLTGYPINNDILSVSVISEECINADALATALMIFNPHKGIKFVENLEKTEVFYVLDGNKTLFSSGFKKYCANDKNK